MPRNVSCLVQVYEHHCIEQLPGPTRRLRDGALYMANNIEAVQWALELYGFKDVCIKVSPEKPAMHVSAHLPSDYIALSDGVVMF